MEHKQRQGLFEAIDSFAIKRRHEFYLIGLIKEGTVQENWFLNVPLNSALTLTLKIKAVEDVEISNEQQPYKLLIVAGDEEMLDILLGMKIGSELLGITVEGGGVARQKRTQLT